MGGVWGSSRPPSLELGRVATVEGARIQVGFGERAGQFCRSGIRPAAGSAWLSRPAPVGTYESVAVTPYSFTSERDGLFDERPS
jgi:hypothetical protein